MKAPDLGVIDRRSLLYGRQDVRATWALYKALRREYVRHPFATFENERTKPKDGRYMGAALFKCEHRQAVSAALGHPAAPRKSDRDCSAQTCGHAIAAYFGGRADVRVRKLDVPVRVLDFTSMYATIFCLQELQKLLVAPSHRYEGRHA